MSKEQVLASVAVLLTVAVTCSISTASPGGSNSTLRYQATLPRVNYGEIIIAGGYDGGYLSTVEVLNTSRLPPLPTTVYGNTLTAVGSLLFSCGGYNSSELDDCFTLDTESLEPQWQHFVDMPVEMIYHTATAVGTHIWFVVDQYIYDLDTETGLFQTFSAPFFVGNGHCAVGGYGQCFVIGVGSNETEVWVNTKESDPSEWKHLLDLPESKRYSACSLFENKIFVTGNWNLPDQQVNIIDLDTNEVNSTSRLQTGRHGHGSFVLDGKPAVGGGYDSDNSTFLNSTETYDVATNTWSTGFQELTEGKEFFGTAQLLY